MSSDTSDHECPDGTFTATYNVINENGAIVPVCLPEPIFKVPDGGRVIAIHRLPSVGDNYLVMRPAISSGETTPVPGSFDLCWMRVTEVSNPKLRFVARFRSDCRDIAVIGNTVIVALDYGIRYFLWETESLSYIDLGQKPPFITLEFGVVRKSLGESEKISGIAASILKGDRHETQPTDEEYLAASNAVLGVINKAINDASESGLFTMPFMVRYAYRLFDGSHYWASSPVLMLPSCLVPLPDAGTESAPVVGCPPAFSLVYHALDDGVDNLLKWKDIIVGIDIFVSAPIYTFDQSANLWYKSYRSGIGPCIYSSSAQAWRTMMAYYGGWTTGSSSTQSTKESTPEVEQIESSSSRSSSYGWTDCQFQQKDTTGFDLQAEISYYVPIAPTGATMKLRIRKLWWTSHASLQLHVGNTLVATIPSPSLSTGSVAFEQTASATYSTRTSELLTINGSETMAQCWSLDLDVATQPYNAVVELVGKSSEPSDIGNVRPSRPGSPSWGGEDGYISSGDNTYFIGSFSEGGRNLYAFGEKTKKMSSTDRVWRLKPKESFFTDIVSTHDFYLYSHLDIENLNLTDMLSDCGDIYDKNLINLRTRATLDDDFMSHHTLIPNTLYSFNSRLHMGGLEVLPPTPLPMRSCKCADSLVEGATDVSMSVWLRSQGDTAFVSGSTSVCNYLPANTNHFPRFIFYPDPAAYLMTVRKGNQTGSYSLPLKPHDYLNGAYWFGGVSLGMADMGLKVNQEEPRILNSRSFYRFNRIYYTLPTNPFVIKPSATVVAGQGNVIALASATKAVSQGQFGQFPLFAFTSDGVWSLEVAADGSIAASRPNLRDVCLSRHSLVQIDNAIIFAAQRGVMLLSANESRCISETVDNRFPISYDRNMPALDSEIAGVKMTPSIMELSDYLGSSVRLAYDYANQRVFVYSPEQTYSYVLSLKSLCWSLLDHSFKSTIPSYPDCLMMGLDGNLIQVHSRTHNFRPGFLLSRPLKLGLPDVHKSLDSVIIRGQFRKGHVRCVLYASNDLFNWFPVWSSRNHYLRGFSGTPFKYFRIAMPCSLAIDEAIRGASFSLVPRIINQQR